MALLSLRVKAFWARVRQGLTILQDRERYVREVLAVQFGGWVLRFTAFWLLLEAFHVGGSVKNVLLVLGVNAVAAAVPFTPGGAGVQQALLVKVFAGTAAVGDRRRLLGGPADRDRRDDVRASASPRSSSSSGIRSFKEVIARGREDRAQRRRRAARAPA